MQNLVKSAMAIATAMALVPAAQGATQAAGQEQQAATYSTSKTTIGALLENPETRTVLEKHIPELVANPGIQQAGGMTLRSIQAYAPDMLTDAKLAAIDADLAKMKQN